MASIYRANIDVSKIDKSKLFQGKKGLYLDVTVTVNDEVDSFEQIGSITIGQSKEERDAKAPKVYLGNLKEVWNSNGSGAQTSAFKAPEAPSNEPDLPF